MCKTNKDCSNGLCVNNLCVPASENCNTKNGALFLTSNGYSTYFECTCKHPEYFSGPTCDDMNPIVCVGGKFEHNKMPSADCCTCASGHRKILTRLHRIPLCLTE